MEANAMRSVLALGLLISLCVSANAATVHHAKPRHHLIVRPSQGVTPGFAIPGWTVDAMLRWLDNASSGWSQA
ncbi:hypothetical protein [Bradyrhizobium erythrophlei]|jgi:hypothetical protein|uniref:hypothetical protein n=1 Tax=Bradyrhizobium erythrophlei TaxID=1437360 RepID=UPI001FDA1F48|nr:hypothetical protein [Bradyrhizobium erythrophlei]